MANILDNPTHSAKIGYNGFDMSQLVKFSSSVGQLLPVYFDILQPGDKVRCGHELKTRTQPMDGPAMMHVEEKLEWFFVPIQQLFKPFEDMYYGIQDYPTDFYAASDVPASNFPLFNVGDLLRTLNGTAGYDQFGISNYANTLRLCDCLGYPVRRFINGDDDGDVVNVNVQTFPLAALAYQKIYSDYYRLSDREANNPACYNVDSLMTSGRIPNNRANDIFKLRYRAWKRDFQTNNFVSPLFGVNDVGANGQSQGLLEVNQWLTSLGLVETYTSDGVTSSVGDEYAGTEAKPTTVGFPESTGDSAELRKGQFNPANIRTMFAVEKLLEITRRAGKHYDKQTLAHFGVDVPTGTAGECFFLGGSSVPISVGTIYSNAATEEAGLAEMAGKGEAFGSNNDITFEAKTHGVLMCIFSAVPEVDYKNYMLDKLNALVTPADFFRPEFDNLGMQPLFQYQTDLFNAEDYANVLGWQYRYSELKTKYNRTWGSLIGSLKNWTTSRDGLRGTDLVQYLINPKFLNSVMTYEYSNPWWRVNPTTGERQDYANSSDYVVPNADDPTQWDSATQEQSYDALYDSDPLLHEIYFNVVKSSKMSTYGLFNL